MRAVDGAGNVQAVPATAQAQGTPSCPSAGPGPKAVPLLDRIAPTVTAKLTNARFRAPETGGKRVASSGTGSPGDQYSVANELLQILSRRAASDVGCVLVSRRVNSRRPDKRRLASARSWLAVRRSGSLPPAATSPLRSMTVAATLAHRPQCESVSRARQDRPGS